MSQQYSPNDPTSFQSHLNSQMQPPLPDNPNLQGGVSQANTPNPNYQYIFKVILIGDSNTGKTSLINRFVNKTFDEKYL